ncbi:hypothetical protein K402DRAFT_395521 [Aulographum hederae CBS 113979]|uniref:Uncharacterized protein n=1 Tax=Aulographum hederae CBS 113979 TaxID=1176131 RepID=A0A6G1GUT3_9PEZI|nr:hypothetical protein K402DRAFT_395521 [Aulographum hederae CBS 113979]
MPSKSVAVIGAGPAGLVAAKTLLRVPGQAFDVTVFERKSRVGGMWAVEVGEDGGIVNPEMPTNLSRFTVSFGDLDWRAVHLPSLPMFPRAWQVGRYLKTYTDRYIPSESIKLGSTVKSVEMVGEAESARYRVQWSRTACEEKHSGEDYEEAVFDHLIVASGFFSKPRPSSGKNPPSKLIHSSQFRHVSQILPQAHPDGNIVVFGGGMSGGEAAANIAFQISDSKHSPQSELDLSGCKLFHVVPRPFYPLPTHLPVNPALDADLVNPAPTFVPLDLTMFDLSRRPEGHIKPSNGLTPPERAEKSHSYLRSISGWREHELPRALIHTDQQKKSPSVVAISDTYSGFVLSTDIQTLAGRVVDVSSDEQGKTKITITGGVEGETTTIDSVVAIVDAAGFEPHGALDWMSDGIKSKLEYDSTSNRLPVLLHHHSVDNELLPTLGFVGFYEGPYWGVMEMQARYLARKWSAQSGVNVAQNFESEHERLRNLRQAIALRASDVPQYVMSDYPGLIEGFAQELGITRDDLGGCKRRGPPTAARYSTDEDDRRQSQDVCREIDQVLDSAESSRKFVSAAAFRALQGHWRVRRQLHSFLAGFPSGTFEGTADFLPRRPTDLEAAAEYLYVEDGTLTTEAGLTLRANKRYAYRYSEAADLISAWFVKEDGKSVDYLFNEIQFRARPKGHSGGWLAKGSSHLCEPDMYETDYEFKFRGAALDSFDIKYVVKGPRKDYISTTTFQR